MQTLTSYVRILRRCAEKLGPYLLLEILLPGGTLLALLLLLYRRRKLNPGSVASLNPLAVRRALARTVEQGRRCCDRAICGLRSVSIAAMQWSQ